MNVIKPDMIVIPSVKDVLDCQTKHFKLARDDTGLMAFSAFIILERLHNCLEV